MAGNRKTSGNAVPWPRPNFTMCIRSHKNFMNTYRQALTYAHYEVSAIDLKKETTKYLKSLSTVHPLLDKIKDLHENRFMVVGKYLYIINHAGELPEGILESVLKTLNDIIEENKDAIISEFVTETPAVITSTLTIQDRLRDKAYNVAGDVEGWIDDFFTDRKLPVKTVEDFIGLFKSSDLKGPHMRHIQNCFDRRIKEVEDAVAGDKDMQEGYSNLSKSEFKKYSQFMHNLQSACTMLNEVAKVERAPRLKKPPAAEKIVSKIKYKKEDNSLGIVSTSPIHILGAKEVWVYNTKTRKLAHYKADGGGFGVKGASLLNYTTESAEKTLRKPVEQLAEFKKATKVKLRTFLKDLSTIDIPVTGKLNEHHVILRVDK